MLDMTRAIGLGLVLAAASVAGAQATARLAVGPASKIWIEGTSNVHDWKCEASGVDTKVDIDALSALPGSLPKSLKKVVVKVPVKSLKCGHGGMDNNLYKALNADANADITYVMSSFETLPDTNKDGFTIRLAGVLKINGTENPVSMDIVSTRVADGTIKAVGTVPIKMTAFGVKPPKALFGTVRAGDEVKVKFEMIVGPKLVVAVIDK